MFSAYTLTTNVLRGLHQHSKFTVRNLRPIRNLVTSSNRSLLLKTQPKVSSLHTKSQCNFLTYSIAPPQTQPNGILHRFCANGPKVEPEKSKKIVGYWLLGCSGMVFTAVVLGGVFVYFVLLLSICTVLEKYLVYTTK